MRFLGLLLVGVPELEQLNVFLVLGLNLHQFVSFPHYLVTHPVFIIAQYRYLLVSLGQCALRVLQLLLPQLKLVLHVLQS